MKRILAIGVILLFIGSIYSAPGFNIEKQSIPLDGKTLYVGGSGPGNYTKIQDAINDSLDGDTVFVYDDSSPYYENLIVDKSINLIGEDRKTTIIDGSRGIHRVVDILADGVTISGFTIQNYEIHNFTTYLIIIQWDYNKISGNIITGNLSNGIYILNSKYNTISGNVINFTGKRLFAGITLSEGKNNNISGNIIQHCLVGIDLIRNSNNNSINHNNFIHNGMQATFTSSWRNKWHSNYWDNWIGFGPKFIFGGLGLIGLFPWLNFDFHPAQEPYDIEV